ncbi:MAG: hypothetical protein KGI27_02965 [Thaumarchaeota archaeon]|nr:hypothetical protein [Nitrososphaerota archaeon]
MAKSVFKNESRTDSRPSRPDPKQIINYILEKTKRFNPTLRSITIIEKLIYENKEFSTKDQLYKKLPKGMQYPVFNFILELLEKENKIMFDKDGAFFWTGQAGPKLRHSLDSAIGY